jgi:20S proteasome subunit beta 5
MTFHMADACLSLGKCDSCLCVYVFLFLLLGFAHLCVYFSPSASRILSHALYDNRQFDLSIGSMIMGFDEYNADATEKLTPKIYYVDSSGLRLQGDCFSVGSGSVLALGILDTERRYEMSVDDAIALGIKAIRHATLRDAYSGGYINVFLITAQNGWQRVFAQDIDEMTFLS